MKKYKHLIIITLVLFCLGVSFGLSQKSCFATNSCGGVDTAILDCADDGSGTSGICHILDLIKEIFTVAVGVLGVIGVAVVGIQYLTAGGNEEKVRKSKRRMYEIILGLAVYAVMAMLVNFLLPGGSFCGASGSGAGSGGGTASSNSSNNNNSNNSSNSRASERGPSETIY